MPKVYSRSIIVSADHIDFNDHVNNLVFLQWALDISRDHWLSVVSKTVVESYFWVVRSHHIDYLQQAFEGDEIEIRTFVESIRGPFSERIVQIIKNGEQIVKVKSGWCFLERSTKKLKRVPEEIKALFI